MIGIRKKKKESQVKNIATASVVSATVGAAVGAAAVVISKKENRDKAMKVAKGLRASSSKRVDAIVKKAQLAKTRTLNVQKLAVKKPIVKKVITKKAVKEATKKKST